MTTDQIRQGYKWGPSGGHFESVLPGAVGLQSGTFPVDWDATLGNSLRLRTLIFLVSDTLILSHHT